MNVFHEIDGPFLEQFAEGSEGTESKEVSTSQFLEDRLASVNHNGDASSRKSTEAM